MSSGYLQYLHVSEEVKLMYYLAIDMLYAKHVLHYILMSGKWTEHLYI